ncbi:helix-turn-helix domain-containing protein [Embleya sp. NPDC005971]|uniref:helix-turn-helix domain-containing protein n=1 Tax=Embleya sp. NPDC005971 TaxID=3156724 RepID=UPI003400A06B
MNTDLTTAEAADQARVTLATVRHWCRFGAVAARKIGRRWAIDAASLAHRVALGIRRAKPAAPKPVVFSVENMVAIGGSRWTKAGKDRVYLNDWATYAGLETGRYNTGNIASASYQGERISNSQAYKILGSIDKVWFDAADGKLHCRFGITESRVATREDVWDAIYSGIRAAIAAL